MDININKTKKGMSLIVLVITIIVMIILAGVVVMGLVESNPIDKANEARIKALANAVKSDFSIFCANSSIELAKVINLNLLEADANNVTYSGSSLGKYKTIYDILPSLPKDNKDFVVTKGKLLFTGSNEKELDYMEESNIELLYRPSIETTVDAKEDSISLKWGTIDTSETYKYKVYQKREDEEFQSISTTDYSSTEKVKVLNIHPNLGEEETFTNYKGEKHTLVASARLKRWMEEPKDIAPKGYGKGIIDVDAITMDDFSEKYNEVLYKDSNGNWSYNVIMIGSWDSCGWHNISENSADKIEAFVKDGGGILLGHDVMLYGRFTSYNRFAPYANVKLIKTVMFNGADAGGGYVPGGTESKVTITKKGMITNYPWKVGDVGTDLIVPISHTYHQHAFGNIWIRFNYQNKGMTNPVNTYVTTWNNAGMMQVGHSNGRASEAEQKILANTLFYLNQIGKKNYLEDYSGQDVNEPNAPVIKEAKINGNTLALELEPTSDNGTKYTYYVVSEGENSEITRKSREKTETITAGLDGYILVVNDSDVATFGENVNLKTDKVTININEGPVYVHIIAVDKVGNRSEVLTHKVR